MTFEEMIGQKAVVQTLKNAVKNNRVAQAYIFSGMRGVGKTTIMKKFIEESDLNIKGFITEEIREKNRRTGFKLVTTDGKIGILAKRRKINKKKRLMDRII